MEYLETFEKNGIKIHGRIIGNKVYIVANDLGKAFGYKSPKDLVSKNVSRKNILKFPIIDGKNGNQINMINEAGANEILSSNLMLSKNETKREVAELCGEVFRKLKAKRDYLKLENEILENKVNLFQKIMKRVKELFLWL